ncbi:MAG: Endoribonuclease [Hyphomicrobiales bacterium]|nr:Endoribonuclease [Hyphomicrobiales bacterium]
MHQLIDPPGIPPSPHYSHGVMVEKPARWLSIAGQVGRDAGGEIPEDIVRQADLAWANVAAVLRAAGMDMRDLVEIIVYLTSRDDNAAFDAARTKWLAGAKPASTKLYIAGLADPRMRCEIQARAARAI